MNKIAVTLLLLISNWSLAQRQHESIIFYRIESIYQAKKEIMDKAWPSVSDTAYSIPFFYFTDTSSYVVNPPDAFVDRFKPVLKFQRPNLTIYQTQTRMDNLPFHMEVKVSDVATDFNYNFPYGTMSGLEETRKVTDVNAESWAGMILHEFFHGYQFRHEAFWKHALNTKLIFSFISDSLQNYYNKQDWFKKSIDQENALILASIGQEDGNLRKGLIRNMFELRDERRKQAIAKFNRPIEFYEKSFETMEGTARYIEVAVITNFHKLKFSDAHKKSDMYYAALPDSPRAEPEWAYKTEVSQSYTYATGYNMVKLLDKLKVDYQTKLFKMPGLTLEDMLREVLK